MIDPKELRLFNLVNFNLNERSNIYDKSYTVCEVLSLGSDTLLISPNGDEVYCKDIDPIPITPEWLERFGFEMLLPHDEDEFIH